MKCARYKYKTLLDKGEWHAPDAQGKKILTLRAEINGLERGKKLTLEKKTSNSRGKNNRQGRNDDRDKSTTKPKRDYYW